MNEQIVSHILRDVSDGIMVLSLDGTITFINPSGSRLLGVHETLTGKKYASLVTDTSFPGNDDFHQLLLDCIYDKEHIHIKDVSYTRPDGGRLYLQMRTSFLYDDSTGEPAGIIIQFTDITKQTVLLKKQKDFTAAFTAMVTILCGWVFLYAVWDVFGREINSSSLTIVLEVVGLTVGFFLVKYTNVSVQDIGLGTAGLKNVLVKNTVFSIVGIIVLFAAKAAALYFLPGYFSPDEPFWDWSALTWAQWIYPITAFAQEFISHGIIQESLDRVFAGKYSGWISIAISSLFFGALHIHKGLMYMICATVLSLFLCVIYRKQRSVWGLTIPHFFLGSVANFLNWV